MSPIRKMNYLSRIFLTLVLLTGLFPSVTLAQENSPKLEILAPTEGQTFYGNKIPMIFKVTNFELTDQETKSPTQGHILLWLDEQTPTVDNSNKLTQDTFTYSDVAYGEHKLSAELVTQDNKSLTPAQRVEINFNSAAVASSAETASQTNSFDKNTALVILVVVALVILAAWWYTKDDEEEKPSQTKNKSKSTNTKAKTVKKSSKGRRKS